MSNEDRELRRRYLLNALRHNDKARQELIAAREANPHAVDMHAINDVGRSAKALLAEFIGIGGNLSEVYPTTKGRKR